MGHALNHRILLLRDTLREKDKKREIKKIVTEKERTTLSTTLVQWTRFLKIVTSALTPKLIEKLIMPVKFLLNYT